MNRIVYLHGFASSPNSKKARYFQERCAALGVEIEIPDLSAGDFEHLTITGQLKVMERVVRNEPVSLFGSSMGGYLAALYAALHTEVQKVVLMAPAFSLVTRWPETLGQEKFDEWRRNGFLSLFHYGDGCERQLRYDLIEDGRFYEDYPNFRQPAIIFHGKNDTVVPPGYSITFSQQHTNTKLYLLDSDHELLNVLDFIWAEVRPFLFPELKALDDG